MASAREPVTDPYQPGGEIQQLEVVIRPTE